MGSLRKTKQKKVISDSLISINSFFSADELYEIVKEKDDSIGIATIYRFLKEAVDKKELYTYSCNKKSVYSKGNKSHCHYICEDTGEVTHFEIDNINFLKDKIPGTISSFQLEVRGSKFKKK